MSLPSHLDVRYDAEVNEIRYTDPEGTEEIEQLVVFYTDIWEREVRNKDNEQTERAIVLTRGGPAPKEGQMWGREAIRENGLSLITNRKNLALGAFFHLSQIQLGWPEKRLRRKVGEAVSLGEYDEWLDNLSTSDRQLLLLDIAEEMAEYYPQFPEYLESGGWRSPASEAPEETQEYIREIARQSKQWTAHCYRTARKAYERFDGHENDRLSYAEGIALPGHPGRATRHAWLEVDGYAAELTWPYYGPVPEDTVYFGRAAKDSFVQEVWERRGDKNAPAFFSDEAVGVK